MVFATAALLAILAPATHIPTPGSGIPPMLRRILSPWPVRIAVLLLTLWVGCSGLCSVIIPAPIWVWMILLPALMRTSYRHSGASRKRYAALHQFRHPVK